MKITESNLNLALLRLEKILSGKNFTEQWFYPVSKRENSITKSIVKNYSRNILEIENSVKRCFNKYVIFEIGFVDDLILNDSIKRFIRIRTNNTFNSREEYKAIVIDIGSEIYFNKNQIKIKCSSPCINEKCFIYLTII